MTTTHTPGPWNWSTGFQFLLAYIDGKNEHILWPANARIDGDEEDTVGERLGSCGLRAEKEAEANARLIAAAPDLLAALEELADAFKGDDGLERAMNIGLDSEILAARAAIAKAKVPA